ncbi:SDR family NAD(P)-dependent oxidoreductase [Terricaulis sp.]|uniref:SDR family NAD(P)-dependent oxidoreductase n=1 Tax=Terricaulis sp. TaxID=2768686 RepID=UPI0037838D83
MTQARAAIVTGGASGIGRACVEMLAERGWAVTIADLGAEDGQALAAAIRSKGGAAQFVRTDVSDEGAVEAMVRASEEAHGPLWAAINSAGVIGASKPVHDTTLQEWDRCSNINLRGMFLCVKYQLAAMWPHQRGAIVAVSSAAAVKGLPNSADYCAAKAGVNGLVRGAALDAAERNIRINALMPGATATPLAARSTASNPNLGKTRVRPMNRMAAPEEIASAAVWLVSDESTFATGAAFAVDGGMTIA